MIHLEGQDLTEALTVGKADNDNHIGGERRVDQVPNVPKGSENVVQNHEDAGNCRVTTRKDEIKCVNNRGDQTLNKEQASTECEEEDPESLALAEKLDSLDAEGILELGKVSFKAKDFPHASEIFSRALEKKVKESGCLELDPSLGRFYLWFGDALLSKEEATDDMLCQLPQASAESIHPEAPSENKEGEEDATDEELAFQMLELSKRCLYAELGCVSSALSASAASIDMPEHKLLSGINHPLDSSLVTAAEDLSFACMRLGDMQLMNSRFDEARLDYAEAVYVRSSFQLPESWQLAPKLSLAQVTFFSGDTTKALSLFKECEKLAVSIRDGELTLPKGTSLKAVKETAEDIQIQIADIEKQLAEQTDQTQRTSGSQSEAKDFIAKTTSSFDPPVLAASNPVKRVAVDSSTAPREPDATGSPLTKQRRIDLTTVKAERVDADTENSTANSIPVNPPVSVASPEVEVES